MLRREVLKWLSWKFFDPLIKDVPNKFFQLVFKKKKKNFVKYKCSIFSFFLEIYVFSHTALLDF